MKEILENNKNSPPFVSNKKFLRLSKKILKLKIFLIDFTNIIFIFCLQN